MHAMPEDEAMLYLACPPMHMAIEQLDLQEQGVGQPWKPAASSPLAAGRDGSHSQHAHCSTGTDLDSHQLCSKYGQMPGSTFTTPRVEL